MRNKRTNKILMTTLFALMLFSVNSMAQYPTTISSDQSPSTWKVIKKDINIKGIVYSLYVDTITHEKCASVSQVRTTGKVKIPKSIKYEKGKYTVRGFYKSSNDEITDVFIPNTVQFIGRDAFWLSENLETVTFEEESQLRTIGDFAFNDCYKLKEINIPETVDSIGSYAFRKTAIVILRLPANIKCIKQRAFYECAKLKHVISEGSSPLIIEPEAFANCSTLHYVQLGKLKKIGYYAFLNNGSLNELRYSHGINWELGYGAFQNCGNLTTLGRTFSDGRDIEKSITIWDCNNIPNFAFKGCKSITKVNLSDVEAIGDYAFSDCTSLSDVFLPDAKVIGQSAFANCTSLKSVYSDECTTIGATAFWQCTSLEEIYFTASQKFVGRKAFFMCKELKGVYGFSPNDEFEGSIAHGTFLGTKCDESVTYPLEASFNNFYRQNMTEIIEEWQKKKEYETIAEYKERVTEDTRNEKINSLKDSLKAQYIAKYAPKDIQCVIDKYDADAGIYKVRVENVNSCVYYDSEYQRRTSYCGKQLFTYAKVPRSEAPKFKEQWENVKIEPTYCIANNYLGVASCKFTLNGKTYESPILYDDETANVELNLSPLDIWKDDKNDMAQEKYDDTLDKNIPQTNMKNEKTFAVIIGNEYYKEVSNVSYAQNDAKVFAEYCKKTLGLPEDNVRSYQNATYGMMLSAVKDMKSISEAYDGDVNFIFYYVGHGIPDEKTREAYLLPIDANPMDMEACYPIGRLYTELGELQAHSVAVFMDACFSGAQRGEGMLVEARGVAIKTKSDAPKGNTIVFSAASGDETAYPYKDKGHGMFTYYLLKKLNETKGDVTLGELGTYIQTNVKQQSVVVNRKSQTPTVVPSAAVVDSWKGIRLR